MESAQERSQGEGGYHARAEFTVIQLSTLCDRDNAASTAGRESREEGLVRQERVGRRSWSRRGEGVQMKVTQPDVLISFDLKLCAICLPRDIPIMRSSLYIQS